MARRAECIILAAAAQPEIRALARNPVGHTAHESWHPITVTPSAQVPLSLVKLSFLPLEYSSPLMRTACPITPSFPVKLFRQRRVRRQVRVRRHQGRSDRPRGLLRLPHELLLRTDVGIGSGRYRLVQKTNRTHVLKNCNKALGSP